MNLPDIGVFPVPENFRYMDVLRKGMPERDEYFYMKHPLMPYGKRAKIFAPFAALKGFEEEVESKEVLYVKKKDLDIDEYYELNEKLTELDELTKTNRLSRQNQVKTRIEYYVICTDEHNEAYGQKGTYEIMEDIVRKVDQYKQKLHIGDELICFSDIYRIEIIRESEDIEHDRF